MAAGNRRGRALLALVAERVDVFARNPLHGRDGIGADALVGLRVAGAQPQIAIVHHERPLAAAAIHRHHFGAAGDHQILGARHDGIGGHVDAGDARAAEAIERDARGAHVVAGIERRHPAEIATLRAALRAGSPDDVVDIGGVDAGSIGQRPQHGGAELLRMDAGERALAGLADTARRPACIDNQRVSHGGFLSACWFEAFAAEPGALSIRHDALQRMAPAYTPKYGPAI
ncbi:hypothetical protein CI41S_60700 [Bradyrhizobium ivorense]|nr:hypothetical protein CI41S_60700 [Bradyrhizobium ivorense]